jgi:hypothetical protein
MVQIKPHRRALHRLGHGMSVSEVILVPLPKRLCIRGRNLLHIVAKRGKLASNIVRRHSRFDANEAGGQVRKPQCDASRNTMAPRASPQDDRGACAARRRVVRDRTHGCCLAR